MNINKNNSSSNVRENFRSMKGEVTNLFTVVKGLVTFALIPLVPAFYYGALGQLLEDKKADLSMLGHEKPPVRENVKVGSPVVPEQKNDVEDTGMRSVGSYAVAAAADMLDREVNTGWRPNDTPFNPQYFLVDLPAYQRGILKAEYGFSMVLADHLARMRAISSPPPEVEELRTVLGIAKADTFSIFPQVDARSNLKKAVKLMREYNNLLVTTNNNDDQVVFEMRRDTISDVIERVGLDIGSEIMKLNRAAEDGDLFSFDNQRAYNEARGYIYANYVILKALRKDGESTMRTFNNLNVYDKLLDKMKKVLSTDGADFVVNTDQDSAVGGNQIRVLSGALSEIKTELKEVGEAMDKGSRAQYVRPIFNHRFFALG